MSKFCKIFSLALIIPIVLFFIVANITPVARAAGCCSFASASGDPDCNNASDASGCPSGAQFNDGQDCNKSGSLGLCQAQASGSNGGTSAGPQKLPNPLGTTSVYDILGRIIKALLGLTGAVALVMFIYGGFLWMFSGGNPNTITKGKNTLIWAVLGLVVIFASYAIVGFVITSITSK